MTSIQCVITAAVENGLRVAAHEVCQAFAGKLAENGMLNCKESEAMALLAQLEITTKRSAAMKKVPILLAGFLFLSLACWSFSGVTAEDLNGCGLVWKLN